MKKTAIIITIIILLVVTVISGIVILNLKNESKSEESSKNEVIFTTKYYFARGSRGVKIYSNGDVYEDLEVEEPDHEENYKLVKTLEKEEIDDLKEKIKYKSSDEEISEFVIELVYGVEEFEENGEY